MFFDAKKEKLLRMAQIIIMLLIFIYISLNLNDHFLISERIQIRSKMAGAQIYYMPYKVVESASQAEGNIFSFTPVGIGSLIQSFFKNELAHKIVWRNAESVQNARSIPVLVYHGIPTEGEGHVPIKIFIEHMAALHDAGWQTVSLGAFEAFLHGEAELPDKVFLLTFDDGRKDSFYPVDPVLRDLGYNAVMFVITSESLHQDPDRPSTYYLSPRELLSMQDTGHWEIESHGSFDHNIYTIDASGTPGHFLSNKLWVDDEERTESDSEFYERVEEDLTKSQQELETLLNTDISAFAFPFGDFGQGSRNYVASEGVLAEVVPRIYDLAFYQTSRLRGDTFNYPHDGYMVKRIEPLPDWTAGRLLEELEAGQAKYIPYADTSFGREWIGNWGEVYIDPNFTLRAAPNTSGAAAYLNGSLWWTDYTFESSVEWDGTSHIILVARQQSQDEQITCDFASDRIALRKKRNGILETVAMQDFDLQDHAGPDQRLHLGITVLGDTVVCLVETTTILESNITDSPPHGGIAIEVWGEEEGQAHVNIDSVRVVPP